MDYLNLSRNYIVKPIEQRDIDAVYLLCKGNPMYYEYMKEEITKEGIKHDMTSLPPEAVTENKFYLGYYEGDELIAVLEMILSYPDNETILIGFFMVKSTKQGKGIGSNIINDVAMFVKNNGYRYIVLSYVEGNKQSEEFWKKNMFDETDEIDDYGDVRMITMLRNL